MRLSGLQKDVLKLYRTLLQSASKKSNETFPIKNSSSNGLYQLVKKEFRDKASEVSKNDFRTIEHLLRYGYKQQKLIDMPGFKSAAMVNKEISRY